MSSPRAAATGSAGTLENRSTPTTATVRLVRSLAMAYSRPGGRRAERAHMAGLRESDARRAPGVGWPADAERCNMAAVPCSDVVLAGIFVGGSGSRMGGHPKGLLPSPSG